MLILASESPRRRELLARLGVPFRVRALPTREFSPGELPPAELPLRNAELKAERVALVCPGDLVLGADTVIVFDGRIIGKPRDTADARNTLLELAGRSHSVVTALALLRREDGLRRVWCENSSVTFKPFTPDTAEQYISLVNVLDKAGSYALQEHGEMLISQVDGDPDNVVGLPLERLRRELAALGIAPATPAAP